VKKGRLLAVAACRLQELANGYTLRVKHVMDELAAEWDILLISPGNGGEPAGDAAFSSEFVGVISDSTVVRFADTADETGLRMATRRAMERHQPDAVLFWPGTEFLLFDEDLPPAVLDMIDCMSLLTWRAAKSGPLLRRLRSAYDAIGIARYERRISRRLECTAVVGEDDARALRRIGHTPVKVIPNGVIAPPEPPPPVTSGPPTLLFSGTLDYPPNIEAAVFCAREILPHVHSVVPDAILVLAGRSPTSAVLDLRELSGVRVMADVPDMGAVLRSAWVALAPMQQGSGIKNKVLEAWAAARPVIMTEIASNGLFMTASARSLVAERPASLAALAVRLLREQDERLRVGVEMHAVVRMHHGWKQAASELSALIEAAARRHVRFEA
jgi:glycosyltransferase involved in cell wall biosynthesis